MNRRDILRGSITLAVAAPIVGSVGASLPPSPEDRAAALFSELHSLFMENATKASAYRLSWEIPFNGKTVSLSGIEGAPTGVLMI